jgi:hypothetical protein
MYLITTNLKAPTFGNVPNTLVNIIALPGETQSVDTEHHARVFLLDTNSWCKYTCLWMMRLTSYRPDKSTGYNGNVTRRECIILPPRTVLVSCCQESWWVMHPRVMWIFQWHFHSSRYVEPDWWNNGRAVACDFTDLFHRSSDVTTGSE